MDLKSPGTETNLLDALQKILDIPEEDLPNAFNAIIPDDRAPSATFWRSYNAKEASIGLRAALLLWTASGSRMVPREFQLEATIASM